jgi:hypothetical protein
VSEETKRKKPKKRNSSRLLHGFRDKIAPVAADDAGDDDSKPNSNLPRVTSLHQQLHPQQQHPATIAHPAQMDPVHSPAVMMHQQSLPVLPHHGQHTTGAHPPAPQQYHGSGPQGPYPYPIYHQHPQGDFPPMHSPQQLYWLELRCSFQSATLF